jgi:hypothetical protein
LKIVDHTLYTAHIHVQERVYVYMCAYYMLNVTSLNNKCIPREESLCVGVSVQLLFLELLANHICMKFDGGAAVAAK